MKLIKISKLAKDLGITKVTLYNWRLAGKILFVKSLTGRNFITLLTYNLFLGIKLKKLLRVVIYCRVSSTVNKHNLLTQKQRLINYCSAKGYKIYKIVLLFGSGINDKRPKLQKLLLLQDFTMIIVLHKDRLTRLGFNYIETLLNKNNIKILVINLVNGDDLDIIQDFVSIITSYCARIYGKRRSKRKTLKLILLLSKLEL